MFLFSLIRLNDKSYLVLSVQNEGLKETMSRKRVPDDLSGLSTLQLESYSEWRTCYLTSGFQTYNVSGISKTYSQGSIGVVAENAKTHFKSISCADLNTLAPSSAPSHAPTFAPSTGTPAPSTATASPSPAPSDDDDSADDDHDDDGSGGPSSAPSSAPTSGPSRTPTIAPSYFPTKEYDDDEGSAHRLSLTHANFRAEHGTSVAAYACPVTR
jgi:hypothetical protein